MTTAPHDLVAATQQAERILHLEENLDADEMPPTWMWPLDWEIERHLKNVTAARNKKYGTNTGDDADLDDPDPSDRNVHFDDFMAALDQ